ncbi:MAG TPA: thiamine pyrophosphate-dependent enzyme, partial [Allocoleopsis sp.]
PIAPGTVNLRGYHPTINGNIKQIQKALSLIKESEKPLLYAGGGAIISNAHEEVKQLIETLQIPITTTLMGKGIFDENHALSLGMVGMHGTAYSNLAISDCDLLIALGARFDDRVTGKLDVFASKAKVIHIDIDPAEEGKNKQPDVPIVGDLRQVLIELLNLINKEKETINISQTQTWRDRISAWKQEYPLEVPHPENSISPQEVMVEIAKQASGAYFITDVGQHQMWAAQFIKNAPRHWCSSGGLGTMGYGLPAAVGVKMALPDQQVICICGDGGFQMNMQELGTISQYEIGVKIVILHNGWLGMVRQWQHLFYGDRYEATNLEKGTPEFSKLADVYNLKGILVEKRENLASAISEMLAHDGAVILDVRVTKEEDCFPMIAPGHPNEDMMGLHPVKS